jgi:hypothetical protein
MDENINLVLTLEEANAVVANLGRLPYEQVFSLVQKIQAQGAPQAEAIIKAREEAQKVEEAKPVDAI